VLTYFLFWDGKFNELSAKGGVGLLISLGVWVMAIFLK